MWLPQNKASAATTYDSTYAEEVTITTSNLPLITAENLTRHFKIPGRYPWSRNKGVIRAVDGVSFSLAAHETLSIVGESGCGKSTTARLMLDLDRPTTGSIHYLGQDIHNLKDDAYRAYRVAVQAVFQDPTSALNPRRRIKDIVAEPLVVNEQLDHATLTSRVEDLLRAVGLPRKVGRSFAHELSGGMRQRVAVAQALALKPDVIILDEPVSALDVSIRAQIMNLLKDLQEQFGIAYVLIAHDLSTVRYLSHHVMSMYLGKLVEKAEVESFFTAALHPYSIALISSAVTRRSAKKYHRIVLGGDVAPAAARPSGCSFHPRCWLFKLLGEPVECRRQEPAMRPIIGPHQAACHFAEQLLGEGRTNILRKGEAMILQGQDADALALETGDL